MTNELIADGIYRVSGMETSLKNGAWVSDAGTYLVTDQTKLADIPEARPGDIAFTAGYGHIWQLDVDSTTWVELPKTAAGTAATQAAASATAAAGSASAAAASASQAQTVAASIPADYTSLSNSVVDLKSAIESVEIYGAVVMTNSIAVTAGSAASKLDMFQYTDIASLVGKRIAYRFRTANGADFASGSAVIFNGSGKPLNPTGASKNRWYYGTVSSDFASNTYHGPSIAANNVTASGTIYVDLIYDCDETVWGRLNTVDDEIDAVNNSFTQISNDLNIPATGLAVQTWETGKAISENGAISTNADFKISDVIPVTDGTNYLVKYIVAENISRTMRVHGYKKGTWVKQLAWKNATTTDYQSLYFTADNSIDGIRISCSKETLCSVYALDKVYDTIQHLYYKTPVFTYFDHNAISATGTVSPNSDWKASDYIQCDGHYITMCFINYGPANGNVRVHAYDSSKNWIEQIYANSIAVVTHGNEVRHYLTIKPHANYKYIRISAPRLTDVEYMEHDDADTVDFNFFAVGDGVTDDTVAAQLAFQLAAGRTLKIGCGTYKITGTIHIPTDICVQGIPNESIFMLADGYALDTVVWRSYGNGYCVFLTDTDSKNIVIDGITLNGTTTDIRQFRLWGIVVYNASNVLIQNCSVNYMNYDADLEEANVDYQPGYGIHVFHSSNVRIVGGSYDYSGYEHIGIEYSDDVTVDGVYMGTAWRVPFQIHQGGHKVKLINSTIECTECAKTHSLITFHGQNQNSGSTDWVEDVVIANNILRGSFVVQQNRGGIQTVQGNERNIIVVGNNMETVGECIHNKSNLDDSSDGAGTWIIANNIFNGHTKGITITAPHVICTGNVITAPDGTHVNITSADGVVKDNIVISA